LGKYTDRFQKRLRGGPVVDHATAGAQLAKQRFGPEVGKLLPMLLPGTTGACLMV
jgi:CRISPR-associated endonuclease/helicase Cas3